MYHRTPTRECEHCGVARKGRRPLPPQRSTEIAERSRAATSVPTTSIQLHLPTPTGCERSAHAKHLTRRRGRRRTTQMRKIDGKRRQDTSWILRWAWGEPIVFGSFIRPRSAPLQSLRTTSLRTPCTLESTSLFQAERMCAPCS